MTAPTDSNVQLAALNLERFGFVQAIGWQKMPHGGHVARWRRGDLLATLALQGRCLTVAFTDRTVHTIPCKPPVGAGRIAQAIAAAATVCEFRPEGVLP